MGQPTTNHKLGPIPTRDFRIAPPPTPELDKILVPSTGVRSKKPSKMQANKIEIWNLETN
jgi:hypothetical protein